MPIEKDYHTFWYRSRNNVANPETDDWRLSSKQKIQVGVWIKELIPLCKHSNLLEIPLDQIAYVSMHMSYDEFWKNSKPEKKQKVDLSYPCIVVPKLRNPFNLPYLLLDGRHRITEMKKAGMASSKFYVISKNELYPYVHTEDDAYRKFGFRKKILSFDKSWINS